MVKAWGPHSMGAGLTWFRMTSQAQPHGRSARGTDALFCFCALKEPDHIQMVDGFLEIRKQNLNRHDKPWCTDTLAWKNVSFLRQSFIVLSGKYIACQGDLLFACTQKYADLHHSVSQSDFSSMPFSLPLKEKEYVCIAWEIVPESCWQQAFCIMHCHKQAKTLARGALLSPGTRLSAGVQLGAAPPRALCSRVKGVSDAAGWHFLEELECIYKPMPLLGSQLWKVPHEALRCFT